MTDAVSGPAVFLRTVPFFCFFAVAFYSWGSLFLKSLKIDSFEGLLGLVVRLASGMFILALGIFLCGILKILFQVSVIIFLVLGVIAFAFCLKKDLSFFELPAAEKSFWILVFVCFGVLACVSFISAHAPVTANDALAYHLYFPKLYASDHSLLHLPTHARSLWPSLMSMLFTAGLLIQGTALAILFNWLAALLAVLSVPACVYFLTRDRRYALYSFCFAAFIPALWLQSPDPYVDAAQMLFAMLAFTALELWRKENYAARFGIFSGFILAAAICVKLFMLIPALILIGVFMVDAIFSDRIRVSQKIKTFGILFASCAIFSGGWFLRSWTQSGNPVFPFLGGFFGGNGFSQRMVGFAMMPKNVLNFLALPWNTSIRVDIFGGEPVGILFLAALPCLIFLKGSRLSFLPRAGAYVFLCVLAWFLTIQHSRFLFPIFPILAILCGVGFSRFFDQISLPHLQRASLRFFCAMILLQFALCAYYIGKRVPPALGHPDAETYLRANERTFAFMQSIRPLLTPQDKILFLSEPRLFYSPVPVILWSPAVKFYYEKKGMDFDSWVKSEGITHLLLSSISNEPDESGAIQFEEPAAKFYPSQLKYEPVTTGHFDSMDPDQKRHYLLMKIVS